MPAAAHARSDDALTPSIRAATDTDTRSATAVSVVSLVLTGVSNPRGPSGE